jgi:hypothetical protein
LTGRQQVAFAIIIIRRVPLRHDAKHNDGRPHKIVLVVRRNIGGSNFQPQVRQPRLLRYKQHTICFEVIPIVVDQPDICSELDVVRAGSPGDVVDEVVDRHDATPAMSQRNRRADATSKTESRTGRCAELIDGKARESIAKRVDQSWRKHGVHACGKRFTCIARRGRRLCIRKVERACRAVILKIAAKKETVCV